jgi:RNA polymerase sigma factor (sigma-70 family)
MTTVQDASTSTTLLGRLRRCPTDQAAWSQFVDRYGPRIHGWCRRWGLQDDDARDVTQDVLLRLARKMQTFTYDPSGRFRAWLKTLARHAWHDFVAGRRHPGRGSGDTRALEALEQAEAREDLVSRLAEEFDQELLAVAAVRVQARVERRTWEAFRLLALEGWAGTRAAAELGMKVGTVFMARFKVQRMLQEEVRKLRGPEPEDSP